MLKLETVVARVLEIEEDQIRDDTSPKNTKNWDSINAILLVAELEKVYNIHFSTQELNEVKNIKDIKRILLNHGINVSHP